MKVLELFKEFYTYIVNMGISKEKKKEYNQKYYLKNRQQILEQKKEYAEKNKNKISDYNKKYREKHRETLIEYSKNYYENNKEKCSEYSKSELGRKSSRIRDWKRMGLLCDDYNKLYEKYINTSNCESCNVELTENIKHNTKTTRCLDHDHETGLFRNVLCNLCNVKRK
jgi:hypothetical protein